jgi:hypothetical protein
MSDLSAVSAETARWIFDDAHAAFHDKQHPCNLFSETQGAIAWEEWQLPVPFLGREMRQGVLFMGANPSYGGTAETDSPRGGSDFDVYYEHWSHVFDGSSVEGDALLYRRYSELGRLALGSDFVLGVDALVIDAIPYRSDGEQTSGFSRIWGHVKVRYTLATLRDCAPRFVVTCGASALWCLLDLFPQPPQERRTPFRLRDFMGKAFSLNTDWGNVEVLPLPHLTAFHGLSNAERSEFGPMLRAMVVGRGFR